MNKTGNFRIYSWYVFFSLQNYEKVPLNRNLGGECPAEDEPDGGGGGPGELWLRRRAGAQRTSRTLRGNDTRAIYLYLRKSFTLASPF